MPDLSHFFIATGGAPVTGMAFWRPDSASNAERLIGRLQQSSNWRADSFVAAALLSAQDGSRVALYGQWQTQVACTNALARVAEDSGLAPSDAGIFELATRLPLGHNQPIRPGDLAAIGEFWTTPDRQGDLMDAEPAAANAALADGGFLSANFHRGIDGTRMVNYAQLQDHEAVARLAAKPGFDPESGYWRDVARNEYHVYVVSDVFVTDA